MKEITLDATLENIEKVNTFINEMLEESDCSPKAQIQIDIALDELVSNVVRYAYGDSIGKLTVIAGLCDNPDIFKITFIDSGLPYNPLEKDDPDVTMSADDRQIGGLGIFMVKKTMDNIEYKYENNQNILSIYKTIH